MKIKVTKHHISIGSPRSCYYCPVALALAEATCHMWKVNNYSITDLTTRRQLHTIPIEVMNFVRDFDEKRKVKPFEFELHEDTKKEWVNSAYLL